MARREPLSRERILAAALERADSSGFAAVTMRGLGEALGFEAMSLYRHVSSKDDLLDGMLDLVLAEWELPADGVPWDAALRRSAESVHAALRRHPWAAQLLMMGGRGRPARLAYMEALLATLRRAGFGAERTYHLYHLIDGHIFGFTLWEIAHSDVALDDEVLLERVRSIPWDDYPNLAEHRDQHGADGPHREGSAFEMGLDLILAGLGEELGATRR